MVSNYFQFLFIDIIFYGININTNIINKLIILINLYIKEIYLLSSSHLSNGSQIRWIIY